MAGTLSISQRIPIWRGRAAAALVRGIQSVGVAACVKHFACNNQEQNRLVSDSLVDERALREIYLRAFEIAVREGRPRGMMSSYNRVNGVYAAENAWLMETVARGEWGFDGLFVTDWGGMSNVPRGIAAGTDLEMPGVFPGGDQELLQALAEGRLSQDRLDQAAGRVAELALGWEEAKRTPYSCDMAAHADLAERIAGESGVLLKNDGALPLAPAPAWPCWGALPKRPGIRVPAAARSVPPPWTTSTTPCWTGGWIWNTPRPLPRRRRFPMRRKLPGRWPWREEGCGSHRLRPAGLL